MFLLRSFSINLKEYDYEYKCYKVKCFIASKINVGVYD